MIGTRVPHDIYAHIVGVDIATPTLAPASVPCR